MNYRVTDHLDEEQIQQLHRMFQEEWWTTGRHLDDTRKIVHNSNVIVALCDRDTGGLLAFARILTDSVAKALILDVIVEPSQRHSGLGGHLIDPIVQHPALKNVRHLELYCLPDLVPFYRKWGFSEELGELRLMRRIHADASRPSNL